MRAIFEARRRARRNIRAGLGACVVAVAGCFLAAASLPETAAPSHDIVVSEGAGAR